MRIFITVLFLILSLQSWTKADDISEFEIEGMSIGDSLLRHMLEKDILDDIEYIYPNDGFWAVTYKSNTKLVNYDNILFHGKKNDLNYIIHSITADLFFSNTKECLKKKEEIAKDIKKNISYLSVKDITKKHSADKKTTTHSTWIHVEGGSVMIACYDWSKQSGHPKTTKVTIDSSDFYNWLNNEAFK